MSYNIGRGNADRIPAIKKAIQKAQPNLLGLSEAVRWYENDRARLTEISNSTQLPFTFYGKANTKYDLSFLASHPPVHIEAIHEGFHHAIIKAVYNPAPLGELAIFIVHLDPRSENERVEEIRRLITLAKPYQHTILAGDFNSLSQDDPYDRTELLETLHTKQIIKFGSDTLRFDCIAMLESHGFLDSRKILNIPFYTTVPTSINNDPMHAAPLRLDYIFITTSLKSFLSASAPIKNEFTETASDHYPIFADFTFEL